MSRRFAALLLAAGTLAVAPPSPARAGHVLALAGDTFTLDGQPFDMWGIRVGSASITQAFTDHLLAQLDDYQAHGTNAIIFYLMGSSGGAADPFYADGHALLPEHRDRMIQIVEACDARGMVAVVGIFYQKAPENGGAFGLRDAEAVREAVRAVTRELMPYGNVVINIANEQNSRNWRQEAPIYDFRIPQNIIDLVEVVHEVDPSRIAGGGGYDHDKNEIIGADPEVDALIFNTAGPQDSGDLFDRFVAAGVVDKPVLNVEIFGGWTKEFQPQGVFPEVEAKQVFRAEVDDGVAIPGLSIFFHSTPWTQGPTQGDPLRFDLAGQGTAADPGIHWYFDYVEQVRPPPPDPPKTPTLGPLGLALLAALVAGAGLRFARA